MTDGNTGNLGLSALNNNSSSLGCWHGCDSVVKATLCHVAEEVGLT